ncbi:11789_t:CDS:2 [Entrophospora sp. SA101]|nr:11789_t:CDS:2 [Entrophospora sp. SA101]
MNNSIVSLYELIKQKSQEKGRPLKIICATSANTSEIGEYKGYLEEKKAVEEFEKKRQETLKAERHNFKKIEGFYTDNTWYTTFAQELLRALKEDLIKELVIISSLRKGLDAEVVLKEKIDKFNKTFCKFPQTRVSLTQKVKDKEGKFGPQQTMSNKEGKIYLLPDYKKCQKATGTNVLKSKIQCYQQKNIDFAIGALEYRTNKLEQAIKALKQQNRPSSPTPT